MTLQPEMVLTEMTSLFLQGMSIHTQSLPQWELISDQNLAIKLATDQCVDAYEDWVNLRERQASTINKHAYQVEGGSDACNTLFTLADQIKFPGFDSQVENEILADLLLCAQSRMILGNSNPFFELLILAYSNGFWPCGWKGTYPQGTLSVFPLYRSHNA